MDELFKFHQLNEEGKQKAQEIADTFQELLDNLKTLCYEPSREFSIVKTKLEEACFFAKKSMAVRTENQV